MRHAFFSSAMLKSRLLLCCAALAVVFLVAMTARAWLVPSITSGPKLSMALPSQPLALAQTQTQTMRVTITTIGFDPDELARAAGPVTLALDNRSGLEEVHLRLDREGGERLVDVLVERGQLDWRGTVTLSTGTYILTEANHPDWSCRITVE